MSNALVEAEERVERPFEGGALPSVDVSDEVEDIDVPAHDAEDD